MKILLTNPPWITKDGWWGCRAGSRWPFTQGKGPCGYVPYPFFLGYATTFLSSKGVDSYFYDAIALGHNYDQFFGRVNDIKPDIVVIETSTPSIEYDLKISEKLANSGYKICLVGPHATIFADQLIELPFVSFIAKGEYENVVLEIATTGKEGIYDYNPILDIDSLPYPYKDKEHWGKWYDGISASDWQGSPLCGRVGRPQLQIYSSRGCFARCSMCMWTHVLYRGKVKIRKASNVLAEIEDCISKYPVKDIFFDSDTWGQGSLKNTEELVRGLGKIGIPFSIMTRADALPLEFYRLLKENGCYAVRMGIESFSQKVVDKLNKYDDIESAKAIIKGIKDLGIFVHVTTMTHVLGQTQADRDETIKMIDELGVSHQTSICVPFPGTPYYDELVKLGLDVSDWNAYDARPSNPNTASFWDNIRRISDENSG